MLCKGISPTFTSLASVQASSLHAVATVKGPAAERQLQVIDSCNLPDLASKSFQYDAGRRR